MKLNKEQINAIVEVLQEEYYKVNIVDKDTGLTKDELNDLKDRNRKIRSELLALSPDAKKNASQFLNRDGSMDDEEETLKYLIDDYCDDENNKSVKAFSEDDARRKVLLLSIDSNSLDEICSKLGITIKI